MILRAVHTTTYRYSDAVSLCQTEVRLRPRNCRAQDVLEHELVIDPAPRTSSMRSDYFGNDVTAVTIDRIHEDLSIIATSLVDVRGTEAIHPGLTPSWEAVRDAISRHDIEDTFDAFQFALESPRVRLTPAFFDYSHPSFDTGRPILECATDLCHRIYSDFKYDGAATNVNTAVEKTLRSRVGVCQDFAHVAIACFRSHGLAARYVSGYLRTGDDIIGANASHAWLSVYCLGFGWIDIDPTNDAIPSTSHITLAWGRDYSDVPPVKGVALGGGTHAVGVQVSVSPS